MTSPTSSPRPIPSSKVRSSLEMTGKEQNQISKSEQHQDQESQKKPEDIQVVEVSDKNLGGYKWLNGNLDAVQFSSVVRSIKEKKLEGRVETLSLVEFRGGTTLDNILTILSACSNLEKLLLNFIELDSFPRSYGNHFTVMLKELVLVGNDKLTRDELYMLSYFNKRINFPALQSLLFQSKKPSTSGSLYSSEVGGAAEVAIGGAEEKLSKKMYPPNDATNSVNTSVVSAFMVKCAESLRSVEAKRRIFIMSPTDKTDVSSVQLERFVCDMNNMGFERILNVQKNLRILICFNTTALPAFTFESVVVCIERCERTLTDIKIRHKFIFKNEFKNPLLGRIPSTVVHDCSMYGACHKLRTLHLDLSSFKHQQRQQQKRERKKHSEPLQQLEDVKPVAVIRAGSIPTATLKVLTIRFDLIDDKEMSAFAEAFSRFLSLARLMLEGNPMTPFHMKPRWITTLLQLPQLQLFELHHYRVRDENSEAWRTLKVQVARIGNDSVLTPNSCICWKNPMSHEKIPLLRNEK